MARSGSGGIVVGGGRMVGFGEVVAVPPAGPQQHQQQQQRSLRERQQVHSRRGVVEVGMPPAGMYGNNGYQGSLSGMVVGLGIMRETE